MPRKLITMPTRVGDQVGQLRLGVERGDAGAEPVHEHVEQHQRDDRREEPDGEEPSDLGSEPLPAHTHPREATSPTERIRAGGAGIHFYSTGRPSPRAISIRWTSEVPSPISSTFASR